MTEYNLTYVKNNKYVFCNRNKGNWRHITNMDEIFNETTKKYPEYQWEKMIDIFPTIKETSLHWILIKFIFLPTGSNCVKCLAMKPGSVMVVATGINEVDTAAMRTAIGCDLFGIWFLVPNMNHFGDKNKPNFVDVSLALKSISIGVYASIHHMLPNGDVY